MSEHTRNDALAAEYVLGTLRGAARRRFETLMEGDPALVSKVGQWQETLGVLDATDQPVQPPARVWRAIQSRLPHPQAADQGINVSPSSLPSVDATPSGQLSPITKPKSRAANHGWQLVSFALAASLVGVLLWPRFQVLNEADTGPRPVAVLASAQGEGGQQIVASFDANNGMLVLTPLNLASIGTEHSLELWLIAKDQKPAPLGLIQADSNTVLVLDKTRLSSDVTLAVSLEPSGGSPTGQPTGAVLYAGKISRI